MREWQGVGSQAKWGGDAHTEGGQVRAPSEPGWLEEAVHGGKPE